MHGQNLKCVLPRRRDFLYRHGMRGTVEERFRAKIGNRTEMGCLLWTGAHGRSGHGQLLVDGRLDTAQRVAWRLANGPIPEGLHVLHRCDNPPCVEPTHLFLGTHADNMADMLAKGRKVVVRGDANPATKVTDEQVETMRAAYRAGDTQASLARRFGLNAATVSRMVRGESRGGNGCVLRPRSRVSDQQLAEMRQAWSAGESQSAIGRRMGLHSSYVSRLVRGEYRSESEVRLSTEAGLLIPSWRG